MLIQADARAIPLRDNCVQCVVTSPPYWGLRDYGHAGQIGLEPTPEAFVGHLVSVFAGPHDARAEETTAEEETVIPESEWRWFGCAGHLIVASECRFHLCTQVGDVLVSTVGEYFPDSEVRELFAVSRGVVLEGQGDIRRADYMRKIGFEEIGFNRLYETMVFRTTGDVCHRPECACGLPIVDYSEIEMAGYNTAGAATIGHLTLCRQYAAKQPEPLEAAPEPDVES